MNRMPEVGCDTSQTINLAGSLGHEAHYFGRDAFSRVVNGFSRRAEKDPEFLGNLRQLVEFARTSKDTAVVDEFIQFGRTDRQLTRSLSEQLFGKWVSLAAEKALPETDGARYLALDGQAERLEDRILLTHQGEKSVVLHDEALQIFVDPAGDIQQRITDAVDNTVRTLSSAKARLVYKVITLEAIGVTIFANCTSGVGIIPTQEISPNITPPAITQTVPGMEPPSPSDFQPTPTDVYHFGSGGPISIERLLEMERQDPTVVKQIEWLNTWGDWYGSADSSIRPMTSSEARTDIVFYEWTAGDGSVHYKAAWKFDAGYPGYILVPPAINWEGLNPPVAAPAGHEIGPGQGPVKISTECLAGSELAGLGVPVGAHLAAEHNTGDWVMVYADFVVARVNEFGVWQLEAPDFYPGLAPTLEQFTLVEKSDIPNIIAYLRSQPSLLAQNSESIWLGNWISRSDGYSYVMLSCPAGAWAIVGSIKVEDRSILPHILIMEVRNSDGERGYFLGYIYDPVEKNGIMSYQRLLEKSTTEAIAIQIITGIPSGYQTEYTYETYLVSRPEFLEAMTELIEIETIPPELETMPLPITH